MPQNKVDIRIKIRGDDDWHEVWFVSNRAKQWAEDPKNPYRTPRYEKKGSTIWIPLRIAGVIFLLFDASKLGFTVQHRGEVPYITMEY